MSRASNTVAWIVTSENPMTPTRRDLFKFAGGAAMGAVLTPAPWRLVTDAAMLSETWPGVPRPVRGEIRARYTNCSLCAAGCAMRARWVGDQPVALMGAAGHPFTRGALCPFGLAAHHLPYHPARLRGTEDRLSSSVVRQAIAKCGPAERIAVLDLRPDRTASWTFRRALAHLPNGTYLAPATPFGQGVAVSLAATKTVVSFGVPLLDGWGTPGNVLALRDNFRLIQVEPSESRTAIMADEWIPEAPNARDLVLAQHGPTLILDAQYRSEILALNEHSGVLVSRRETPVPDSWKAAVAQTALDAVPDRSIRILFIDESAPEAYIPWSAIEKKLVADNALVVAFAWSPDGYARHAHFVLPTAVFPEALDDIPAAIDSPAAMFRLSAALVAAPAGVVNAAQFVAQLAGLDAANALSERAAAIHKAARGTLFTSADSKSTPLKDVKADDFWKALNEGATWIDEVPANLPAPRLVFAAAIAAAPTDDELPLHVILAEAHPAPGSPILSKLYQESNLRLAPDCGALHPATAQTLGVSDGGSAVLQTRYGKLAIRVSLDSGMPPGAVRVAASPRTLDLCGPTPRAKVVSV